jgi:hypothetical protein
MLRPRAAARLVGVLQFLRTTPPQRAVVEPRVLLRLADNAVIATATDDLFSPYAAQVLAALVPERRLQAATTLASLLSAALHDPDDLERQRLEFAATVEQFDDRYVYELPPEDQDVDLKGEVVQATPRKRARQMNIDEHAEQASRLLADPNAYRLSGISEPEHDGIAPAADLPPGNLRPPDQPPTNGEERGSTEDDGQDTSGDEDDGHERPPGPSRRYSNPEIEAAARPFVERFEVERGCTITRQRPRVGADYRATDGRYIEVKAFGDEAPSSFDLEPYEWRAARNPQIAPHYWVYVVDHLLDGKAPRVTAIRNPVLDDSVTKQPAGKLRVRGWRSASEQQEGTFVSVGDEHDATTHDRPTGGAGGNGQPRLINE